MPDREKKLYTVNCLHVVDLTTSWNASAASSYRRMWACHLLMPLYVCMQFLCLKLILKLSQSIILVACKKHLLHEGNCMQQILPLSLPDCQFALIIPLFFLMQPEISQPLFLSYLDRMIELAKNTLYLLINAAQVGLSKVSHLTNPNMPLLQTPSSLHSHYSPVFHTSIDCIYSLYH